MATTTKIVTTQSARRKLELSQVTQKALQQELMGTDVGIDKFAVYLSQQVKFNLADRIVDATISRTMDVSSTLSVTINDYDRQLLTSGYLYNKLDVTVDGLWFRLLGVDKQGDNLVLTFEDREIAVLRTYNSWKVANRSKVTRAQFVLNLIREVKEFYIPVVIPELMTVQPLQRYDGDTKGIDATMYKRPGLSQKSTSAPAPTPNTPWVRTVPLQVANAAATKEQLANARIIMSVGDQMKVNPKVMVSALMTSIQESGLKNLPYHYNIFGGESSGLFQQTPNNGYGSAEDRVNPETSARMYYERAIKVDIEYPHLSLTDLCYYVQHCAAQYRYDYGKWEAEAKAFVSSFGIPLSNGTSELSSSEANGSYNDLGAGGQFYYYRGTIDNRLGQKIRKPENSWDCITRLASDVNWKAFFVSGTFYFISEDDLIKQEIAATINEWTDGIISIDGNFYEHKTSATLTVVADVGKWIVPPGRLIVVTDMGPWDGRWLVSDFERSLFDIQATITLERERPALPEPNPKGGNVKDINPTWVPKPQTPKMTVNGKTENPQVTGDRIALAKQLLTLHNNGWTDYNTGYQQMLDTAAGRTLIYPPTGAQVNLDPKIIAVIIYLITEKGFEIGTFAWCTDHSTQDGLGGHEGGHAVDISEINGVAINQYNQQCYNNVIAVDTVLHNLTGKLAPRQLITGGYGTVQNGVISQYTIPNAGYYGPTTMSEHCNHIHVGY